MLRGGAGYDNKPLGEDRPYAGSYSGGDAGYLRMADHYCVHAEGNLVHFVPDSAVRCDMIDYEEVVEAIWRYDIPRIDIDEDITTLYADGKAFAQVIHRADGSREDLYFENYELQKDILIKPKNAKLRDVVEFCMNGDISYADAREWCMENDISLGQFDRWLYGALRKSDNPDRVEPKEPWPYRVVAGHQAFEVRATDKQEAIKKGMAFAKKHASGDICGDWKCKMISEWAT